MDLICKVTNYKRLYNILIQKKPKVQQQFAENQKCCRSARFRSRPEDLTRNYGQTCRRTQRPTAPDSRERCSQRLGIPFPTAGTPVPNDWERCSRRTDAHFRMPISKTACRRTGTEQALPDRLLFDADSIQNALYLAPDAQDLICHTVLHAPHHVAGTVAFELSDALAFGYRIVVTGYLTAYSPELLHGLLPLSGRVILAVVAQFVGEVLQIVDGRLACGTRTSR